MDAVVPAKSAAHVAIYVVPADIDHHVGPGHVVNVNDVSYTVIDRLDDRRVTIQRPGGTPPTPAVAAAIRIHTFEPQRRAATDMLLAPFGIDAHDVVNRDQVRMLGALWTLHLVFSAASVLSSDDGLQRRAMLYASRTDAFRQRIAIRTTDASHALAFTSLTRA